VGRVGRRNLSWGAVTWRGKGNLSGGYRLPRLKWKVTCSMVLSGPGAYFHFMTACAAYSDSMGLPPLMSAFKTSPVRENRDFDDDLSFKVSVPEHSRILRVDHLDDVAARLGRGLCGKGRGSDRGEKEQGKQRQLRNLPPG
jgi:hypothetical protein